MPRVLITGLTGFVGGWMQRKKPAGVELFGGGREFYESGEMDTLENITHIVHLANVAPYKVIELAQKHGARLLYCSSGIVYYPGDCSLYGLNKTIYENLCLMSGVDLVIARLFTFLGDGLDDNKAIKAFFNAARAGKPLKVYGDGSTVRSYMHGRDLGVEMWRILLEGKRGMVYDVGSKRPVTIKRLAERISAFTGAKIEYTNDRIERTHYLPK